MRALFDDFCKAIKTQLPNAKISWDISAWIGEATMNTWWGYFKTSPYISFVHTSGGQVKKKIITIFLGSCGFCDQSGRDQPDQSIL
jgi:hypothetical protein